MRPHPRFRTADHSPPPNPPLSPRTFVPLRELRGQSLHLSPSRPSPIRQSPSHRFSFVPFLFLSALRDPERPLEH